MSAGLLQASSRIGSPNGRIGIGRPVWSGKAWFGSMPILPFGEPIRELIG